MRFSRKHKVTIGIVALIAAYFTYAYFVELEYGQSMVASCINRYIHENNGGFPESLDDLTRSGLFKVKPVKDHYVYSVGYSQGEERGFPGDNPCFRGEAKMFGNPFRKYTIRYGTTVDELEIVDHKLRNKETGEQVFLIEGPPGDTTEYHELISVALFKNMLQLQSKGDGEVDPATANSVTVPE